MRTNSLLKYAAQFWGDHTREALDRLDQGASDISAPVSFQGSARLRTWNLQQMVPELLNRKGSVSCMNEAIDIIEPSGYWYIFSQTGPTGVSDLQIVATFGIVFFVEFFLSRGDKIDHRDSRGMTALHRAARNGHLQVARILLTRGAKIDVLGRDSWTPLDWAVAANRFSVVQSAKPLTATGCATVAQHCNCNSDLNCCTTCCATVRTITG
jgi:hypothetical protein